MRKTTWVPISIILISLFCLGIYIISIIQYLINLEGNTCDMTYMFQYPQYVPIKLDPLTEKKYSQFGLYAYGESYKKIQRLNFNGIPVLFVPGNAGSHEQVRSIASISLRMGLKQQSQVHFDYFTVSLAKGLSALYGGVLEEQTIFVSRCIQRILSLYNGKIDQIVVIGHSMGGIVAKTALLHTASNYSVASILINLASPHLTRVAFDKVFSDYYKKLYTEEKKLKSLGTTLVSIGGGSRDLMVSSSQIIDPVADINTLTTAIPTVWKSVDHLSILWCKQFVIVLNRALFDCVNTSTSIPKIMSSPKTKLDILTYHLVQRFSGKHYNSYTKKTNFETNGQWIEITAGNYTFDNWDNINKTQHRDKVIYFMIPLSQRSTYSHLYIDILNVEAQDWLFICSASASPSALKTCKWGWNVTNRTSLLPDYQHRLRKSVDLELKPIYDWSRMTHMIIRIPANNTIKKLPIIHVDMYTSDARRMHINLYGPHWLPSCLASIIAAHRNTILKFPIGTSRYFLDITGLNDAMYIILEKITDVDQKSTSGYVIIQVIEFIDTNSIISEFHTFTEKDIGKFNIVRLQTSKDVRHLLNGVEVKISMDPRYSYTIRICRAYFFDRIVSVVRDHWFRLYPLIISLLLLSVATKIDNSNYRMSTTVVITVLISLYLEVYFEVLVTIGFLTLFSIAICCVVVFSGSLVYNLFSKFLARAFLRFPISWYDCLLRQGFEYLSLIGTFFVIILVSSSCGAVVMILSVIVYFLKLCRMYEDYLEELLMTSFRSIVRRFGKSINLSKNDKPKKDKPHENVNATENIINHLLMFMIWCFTALSAIPSTLVWAKTFSYESRLATEDIIMYFCWIVLTLWGSLGLVKIPVSSENNSYYVKSTVVLGRLLGWILICIAGSPNPADHQWTIPPIVTTFVSYIIIFSIIANAYVR